MNRIIPKWWRLSSGFIEAAALLGCLPLILFLLLRQLPADPARIVLGPQASAEAVAILRHQMGLDRSAIVQLAQEYGRVLTLNFGASPISGRQVLPEVTRRFGLTLRIGLLSTVCAMLGSLALC